MSHNSLCVVFQYFDLDNKTQNWSQYYYFLHQLTLVMDSQQSAWNCQSIYVSNHEKKSIFSSTWILNIYYFHWLITITYLCQSPLIQYMKSGQFLTFLQTSHNEWKMFRISLSSIWMICVTNSGISISLYKVNVFIVNLIYFLKINIIKRESSTFGQ